MSLFQRQLFAHITYDSSGTGTTLSYSYTGNRRSGYSYDVNGNVTSDATKNLQSSYNLINLPAQIKLGSTVKANYTYLSDGTKAAAYTSASAGRDSDFGARLYDRSAWTAIDPLAEKYYSVSPYAFCKNTPVSRIDPIGMDDYRYDNKTGQFYLMDNTEEKTDNVYKYYYNKRTGEYERKGPLIAGIEKGILSDNANFMCKDNVIPVGKEGQPSVEGVEAFVLDMSEMVGKEIGGAYFSKDGANSITHISIGRYIDNSYNERKGGHGENLWLRLNSDSSRDNSLTGFFHTHIRGADISDSDRLHASDKDLRYRDNAHKIMPNLQFFILTYPLNNGGKIPY